jgi:hypothetical protein
VVQVIVADVSEFWVAVTSDITGGLGVGVGGGSAALEIEVEISGPGQVIAPEPSLFPDAWISQLSGPSSPSPEVNETVNVVEYVAGIDPPEIVTLSAFWVTVVHEVVTVPIV